jgi:hypothetical protein
MPGRSRSESRKSGADRDPEGSVVETSRQEEMNELAEIVLRALPPRDREVLSRFSVRLQCPEQICKRNANHGSTAADDQIPSQVEI